MYKVIIADDNPVICQALSKRIPWKELDLELVGICGNGDEVISKISKTSPDILITDIRMPSIDGLTLIKRLRKHQGSLQIIIISGYSDKAYLEKAIEFDVINYLYKPIQDEKLMKSLKKAINNLREEENHIQIINSIKTLKSHELISDFNKYLLLLINRATNVDLETIENVKNNLVTISHQWILFQIPFNRGYNFQNLNTDMLLKYQNAVTAYFSLPINIFMPIKTMIAVFCPLNPSKTVKIQEYIIELLKSDGIFIAKSSISKGFYSIPKMEKEFKSVLSNLYNQVFGHTFFVNSFEAKNQHFTFDEQQILHTHLTLSDYKGAKQFLDNKLVEFLNNDPRPNDFDSMILTALQIYSKYISTFSKLYQQMNSNFLSSLGYLSFESIRELFQTEHINDVKVENRTEEILTYIKLNFTQPLTLNEISHKFHYNSIYLGQLIKHKTGMSFNHYRNDLRIKRAQEILDRNHEIKITDLATELGYSDSKYFSKVFKNATGLSPSDYLQGRQ